MNLDDVFRLMAALGAVLGLILLAAWALKRSGLTGLAMVKSGGPARLGVVEVRPLDARRQMVLIRRDEVEHLVILSATGETVIETGIPVRASGTPS